ncbi:hypothetical protein [Propionivibrio sp.]|uniref:hypothetical protein n=1 Tax=Propionivibrio sp. TaxID=2212460 RepID=UPI0026075D1C|nr:hypothetical protein [Propionivibrio sp.]
MSDAARSTKLSRIITITFLVFGLVLVSLESAARYFDYPQPYSALFAYDVKLGYRSPANTRVIFQTGEHTHAVVFDNDGIADRAGNKDAEIAILGDGVIAGLELPPQDRIANQLSRLNDGVGVINLSVTGYGTIQQALLLEEWLESGKIKPKAVFLVFNLANDFIDDIREWDGSTVPNVSLSDQSNKILPPILPPLYYRIFAKIWRKSAVAGFIPIHSIHSAVLLPPSPSRLPYLIEELQTNDLPRGLAGTKIGFEQLKILSTRYGFKLYATIWKDPRELELLDNSSISKLESNVKIISSSIHWIESDFFNRITTNEKFDAHYLTDGTRHANAVATKGLSENFTLIITKAFR